MRTKSFLTVAIILGLAQLSNASGITSAAGHMGTIAVPGPLNGAISNINLIHLPGPTPPAPLGHSSGAVAFDANAFTKFRPFDIQFMTTNTFAMDGIASRFYHFSVDVTNQVGQGLESLPLESGSVGDPIQNIEFEIIDPTAAGHVFTVAAIPGAPGNPLIYVNGAGNQVLRFGGMTGAGPAIANGATRTFTFNVTTMATATPFSLRITANPEPGSIILALIVVMSFGGYYYYQRKQQPAPETAAMLA